MKMLLLSFVIFNSISAFANIESEIKEKVYWIEKKTGLGNHIKDGVMLSKNKSCSAYLNYVPKFEIPSNYVQMHIGNKIVRIDIEAWNHTGATKKTTTSKSIYQSTDWTHDRCLTSETITFTQKSVSLQVNKTSCHVAAKNKSESMVCKY